MTDRLDYQKIFDPKTVERRRTGTKEAGDLRKDPVYVYSEEIVLAVNVALATRRPILVRGPSGSGKSSLARNVAHVLERRYYEKVITSRTQAGDLLYEIDLLKRLRDAQEGELKDDYTRYVLPGPLWWAMSPGTASLRGASEEEAAGLELEPLKDPTPVFPQAAQAVVLLDEIDKADPDVPNNLLVPLGSLQFQVEETGVAVAAEEARAPLVFITTNEERELPGAFLRRCVELEIALPSHERLVEIAKAHFPRRRKAELRTLATTLLGEPDEQKPDAPVDVSPAEFLDTVRAADELVIAADDESEAWRRLTRATVWKFGRQARRATEEEDDEG